MNLEIDIKWVSPYELKPSPKNPNKHSEEQIERLAQILKYQGFRSPIVVSNQTGHIVVGHGRVEAAIKAGMNKVPVSYQDFEDWDQEYAHMVADNSIADWADLDLSKINAEIENLGPDLDLDLLGLKDFLLDLSESDEKGDADETPPVPKVAKSKLGDLWILGNHRLLCGDSTDIACVERLMNGEKADMVFTDPPYGYSYESNYQNKHKMLKNDDVILDFLPCAKQVMAKDSSIYVCASHQTVDKWKPLIESNFDYKNLIVWEKNNWSMGDLKGSYAGKHELIFFATQGDCKIIGKRDPDVWKFDREPPKNHPTQKPIPLIEYALSKFQSGKVLDLFGGSGSTLIACEKTNRKCFMMELDPIYVDVILQRWSDYTGLDPVREDGAKWSKL